MADTYTDDELRALIAGEERAGDRSWSIDKLARELLRARRVCRAAKTHAHTTACGEELCHAVLAWEARDDG
jgi:hypothetical protein